MVSSHGDRGGGQEPEATELLRIALPLLGHPHMELQEHLGADERLDLRAHARRPMASREPLCDR